jgi:hypothetical protein
MVIWDAESKIELIFVIIYGILFILNIVNVFKHGIARVFGYVFLLLVSCLKIAGDTLLLEVYTGESTSIEVAIWGLILSQLGFFPLLNATFSFIHKWIGTWQHEDPSLTRWSNIIRIIHPLVLGALVCAVLGGVWTNPTSGRVNTGYDLRRVSDILFLFVTSLIMGIVVRMMIKSKSREQRFDLLLVQVLIVTFILLVRIIYATAQAFLSTPQNPNHNTWVYLGLLLIPDCLAISIYTICGLILKPTQPAPISQQYVVDDQDVPSQIPQPYQADSGKVESPQATFTQRGPRRKRRIRGPIHMLIDAVTGNRQ